ncbi:MAG: glycosyltransferase family 4 protein [Anaerolineae bacterium]|nr:glycosyltransferase family 4 protein [Anaerolineae bacterium]
MQTLRVCLDARMIDGQWGGVQQVVIGLASALSGLEDGDETYAFLVYEDACAWLEPYIGGPCRLLKHGLAPRPATWKQKVKAAPLVQSLWKPLSRYWHRTIPVPVSDGAIEQAGIGLMHFVTQNGFLTDIPSIYQPWDLQHLHLPELFTQAEINSREIRYRRFCHQAAAVAVASRWARVDLLHHYRLPEDKVIVVPMASVLAAYTPPTADDLAQTARKFALPERFIFYPAQTWPHKNHLSLLDALASLRADGLTVPLVCTGTLNEFYPRIAAHVRRLGLEQQVRFLGYVAPADIQCLYRLAEAVVIPSRFESWGLPVSEAFMAGVPVAASTATSLPELVGDAGLLFDPTQPAEIAAAVRCLWVNEALRCTLIRRGIERARLFSWERTARIFRAHYRRITGRQLTEEDRALVAAPPPI